ncbi:MAG: helix-turn-helix domain-containing protein [Planctomycetes bacterium]|nr:helix-turn-helix domain-containing protein [Planctomycetota bacterium]
MKRQTFLQELGRRLRQARERAGLSVTSLADAAGLSRRYVTEAEAGRANVSVLKLAELARALRIPLAGLVDHPLDTHGGERVALVGLRGAGKSTIGRALALRLETPFVELDQRVEELAGLPLNAVVDLHGVEGYRRFEAEALERVLAEGERVVIATGGSIVTAPRTFERLRSACRTVWLAARPEDHFQRVVAQGDARPMRGRPRAMEELARLLAEREPAYARCDLVVDTSGRAESAIVEEILQRLQPGR